VGNSKLPQKLCNLIDGLLSKVPKQRPSLNDVVIPTLRELNEISLDHPTSMVSDTVAGATSSFSLRKKVLLVAALVVCSLGAILIVVRIQSILYTPEDNAVKAFEPTDNVIETAAYTAADRVEKEQKESEPEYSKVPVESLRKIIPRFVRLKNTDLNDQGLAMIQNPHLFTDINISMTKVSSLEALNKFTGVKALDISLTKISNVSLKNLEKLYFLERLDLHDTPVGDDGLQNIRGLTHISWLDLSGTKVTANGLKIVDQFAMLRDVYLLRSEFTKEDADTIAKNLPPFCTLNISLPDSAEGYPAELTEKYPDLLVNEVKGSLFADKETVASLLKDKNSSLNLAEAKILLIKMIDKANECYGPNTTRTRYLYYELGNADYSLKKWSKAADSYREALRLAEESGDKFLRFMAAELLITGSLQSSYDLRPLKTMITQLIKYADEWYGTSTEDAFEYHLKWAGIYSSCKNWDSAVELLEKECETEKAKTKQNQRLIAYMQGCMGDCYYGLKQPEKAKRSYASAAKTSLKFKPELEREFLMQLMCYRAPAELAMGEGKFQVARKLNDEARKICASSTFRSKEAIVAMQEIRKQTENIQNAISK